MAIFNPSIGPDTQERNYIGYSQGTGTDKTGQTLFEGVGDVVIGGAKAVDQKIQKDIYQEADQRVGVVRDLFGVKDATRPTNIADASPSELAVQEARLARLKKGYESGTVTETHYLGMLQDIVKGLRTKYPGYEMQIDDIIQNITGLTPANAIIKSIQADAAAEKTAIDKMRTERENILNQHGDEILMIYPDLFSNPLGPDKYSTVQLQAAFSKVGSLKLTGDFKAQNLSIRAQEKTLTDKELSIEANNVATQYGSLSILGMTNVLGGTEGMKKLLADVEAGQMPSPEQMAQLSQGLFNLKKKIISSVKADLSKSKDPDNPTFNIWSNLTQEDRDGVIKEATRQIDLMIDNANGGKWNLFAGNAMLSKAITDGDYNSMLQIPTARVMGALSSLPGQGAEVAMANWLSGHPKEFNDFTNAIGQMVAGDLATGGASGHDFTTNLKLLDPKTNPNVVPGAVTTVLEYASKLNSDPTIDPKIADNSITMTFGKNAGVDLNVFLKDKREQVFSMLTTPNVTNRVFELGKSNPRLIDNYTTWAKTWFTSLFQERAADIQRMSEIEREAAFITFDPKTGQLSVIPKPLDSQKVNNKNDAFLTAWGSDPAHSLGFAQVKKDVDALNRVFATMKPIVEAQGNDFAESVSYYLPMLGIQEPKTDKGDKDTPVTDSNIRPELLKKDESRLTIGDKLTMLEQMLNG